MTSEGQVNLKAEFPESPFPGIHPYSSAQARVFFGREKEIRDLSRLIFIHRGVLLFGRSGIGKSSLIHAGLVPELIELGLTPYRVRVQPIPGGELSIERMPAPPGGGDATVLAADQLRERVLKKTDPESTPPEHPILIFDQFEEWVTLFETQVGAKRAPALACQNRIQSAVTSLLADESIRVKIFLALREDYVANITPLVERTPKLADCFYRVKGFTSEQIRKIIERPFLTPGNLYTPKFSSDLCQQIAEGFARDTEGEYVDLTKVQIVCERLWRARSEYRDPARAYKALGSAEGILAEYFSEKIEKLPENLRIPAIALLGRLVTSRGTRNVLSHEDLIRIVSIEDSITPDDLDSALGLLEKEARLVRKERRREVDYFEIASEFLVGSIQEESFGHQLAVEKKRREKAQRRAGLLGIGVAVLAFLVVALFVISAQARSAKADAVEAQEDARLERDRAKVWGLKSWLQGRRATAFAFREEDPKLALTLLASIKAESDAAQPGQYPASQAELKTVRDRVDKDLARDLKSMLRASGSLGVKLTPIVAEPLTLPDLVEVSEAGDFLVAARSPEGLDRCWLRGAALTCEAVTAEGKFTSLALDRSSRWLAAALESGAVLRWDLGDRPGQVPQLLDADVAAAPQPASGPRPRVLDLAFDDDAELLAMADATGHLTVLRIRDRVALLRKRAHSEEGHVRRAYSVALGEVGGQPVLLSGGSDKKVHYVNVQTGVEDCKSLDQHAGSVVDVEITKGRFATASFDETSRMGRLSCDNRLKPRHLLKNHRQAVVDVDFDSEGQYLVSASLDGTARVWATEQGKELIALRGNLGPLARAFLVADPDPSPIDPKRKPRPAVLTVGRDGRIHRFDLKKAWGEGTALPATQGGPLRDVRLSPGGRWLAAAGLGPADGAGFEGQVDIWCRGKSKESQKLTWKRTLRATDHNAHGAPVRAVSWCAAEDESPLLVSGGKKSVAIWKRTEPEEADGHSGCWTPSEAPKSERETWQRIDRREEHSAAVNGITCAPHGGRFLSAADDGFALLWKIDEEEPQHRLDHDGEQLASAHFLLNGETVLTATKKGVLSLWSLEDGEYERRIWAELPDIRVQTTAVALGANQLMVAAAGTARSIYLLQADNAPDPERRVIPRYLQGHTSENVHALQFDRDGTLLFSGASDATVRVWDVKSGETVYQLLDALRWGVFGVDLDAGDGQVFAACADRQVRSYPCAPCALSGDDLNTLMQSAAASGRALTPEEQEEYGPPQLGEAGERQLGGGGSRRLVRVD